MDSFYVRSQHSTESIINHSFIDTAGKLGNSGLFPLYLYPDDSDSSNFVKGTSGTLIWMKNIMG